ncbi:MAG TPA: hypothetical protein VJS89_07225 [Gammaproteobacteria bacterium]|nr:hypothetical protein [Gammaproteobacteria bacterium]
MFRRFVRLRCPECDERIALPRRKLAVGQSVRCLHCGAGLYVNHVHAEPDSTRIWQLESRDPLEEERLGT